MRCLPVKKKQNGKLSDRFSAGPQPVSILGWCRTSKSGPFGPNPLIKPNFQPTLWQKVDLLDLTPFLVHFVAKSGPFGRFRGSRVTPPGYRPGFQKQEFSIIDNKVVENTNIIAPFTIFVIVFGQETLLFFATCLDQHVTYHCTSRAAIIYFWVYQLHEGVIFFFLRVVRIISVLDYKA